VDSKFNKGHLKREHSVKISAGFLALGGLLWSFKAAAIIVTGDQPPLTFELGQLLFPIGAVGFYMTFERPRRLEKAGLVLAVLGIAGSMLALLYPLLPGVEFTPSEDFVFPYSLFVLAGGVGGFLSLILIGIAFFRRRRDLGNSRAVPVLVALIPIPVLITGVIHFEMPIFLIGIGWMALAYFLWSLSDRSELAKEDTTVAA